MVSAAILSVSCIRIAFLSSCAAALQREKKTHTRKTALPLRVFASVFQDRERRDKTCNKRIISRDFYFVASHRTSFASFASTSCSGALLRASFVSLELVLLLLLLLFIHLIWVRFIQIAFQQSPLALLANIMLNDVQK